MLVVNGKGCYMKKFLAFFVFAFVSFSSFALTNSCGTFTGTQTVHVLSCPNGSDSCRPQGVDAYSGTFFTLANACPNGVGPGCYDGSCSIPYSALNPAQQNVPAPAPLPFLSAAFSAALAIAAMLLAGVAFIVGAPTLLAATAFSVALIAAIGALPGFGSAANVNAAAAGGDFAIRASLVPSIANVPLPQAGDVAGPSIVTQPNGLFAPAGGGLYTGSGATGGWRAGATGGWEYAPGATVSNPTPAVTATVSGDGSRYSVSSPSMVGKSPVQVRTVTRSAETNYGPVTTTVLNSSVVNVTTAAGVPTTANVSVATTYASTGLPSTAPPKVYVDPLLGNGAPVGTGAGMQVGGAGAGGSPAAPPADGGGGGGGNTCGGPGQPACVMTGGGNTCGGPGQPKCQMEGGGSCGGTGQPPCKIDETGTPTGAGAMPSDVIASEFDKLNGALESIKSIEGKDTSWGLVPHWLTNAGGCTPSEVMLFPAKMGVPPLTLDLCPLLPKIYTLMNLLWVAATFGIVIQMVLRVTT